MTELIRTFIAVELPENIRSAILQPRNRLQAGLSGIRWVAPENLHLTLHFLGDIGPEDVARVSAALSAAVSGMPVFSVCARGIGAFPSMSRPRVLWIGLGGDVKNLGEIYRRIGEHLEAMGLLKEKRDFTGHLTIGRMKEKIDPAQLVKFIKGVRDFETEPFPVDRVTLFRSEVKPHGPVYTALDDAFLMSTTLSR